MQNDIFINKEWLDVREPLDEQTQRKVDASHEPATVYASVIEPSHSVPFLVIITNNHQLYLRNHKDE